MNIASELYTTPTASGIPQQAELATKDPATAAEGLSLLKANVRQAPHVLLELEELEPK